MQKMQKKKQRKKLPHGIGNMDIESFRFLNILTKQDRQLRMPGSCLTGKFQPSLRMPKKNLFRATFNSFNTPLLYRYNVYKYVGLLFCAGDR